MEAIAAIVASLESLRDFLTEKLSGSGVPEMSQLMRTLQRVAEVSQTTDLGALMSTTPAAQSPSAEANMAQSAAPAAAQDWRTANLTSRDDAQLMLEKVKQYFTQHEPSHPAPLMIERVQRMVEMDFMDIIRDLAPDGVHQLENIFGRRNN